MRYLTFAIGVVALSACRSDDGISRDTEPFSEIAESEKITALGTEPFWTIEVAGAEAVYSSPENLEGKSLKVSRFAGNNGLGFSAELDGQGLVLTITAGNCSDGMSDRVFPYTATLALADDTLEGCAYTDKQGFKG